MPGPTASARSRFIGFAATAVRQRLDEGGGAPAYAIPEGRADDRVRRVFVDVTIDDPKSYARPWSVTQEFGLHADDELIEYVCNENNRDVEQLVGK